MSVRASKFLSHLVCIFLFCQPLQADEFFNDFSAAFVKTKWKKAHDLFIIHAIPKCGTHFIQRTIELMTGQECANFNITLNTLTGTCNGNKVLRSFQPYSPQLAKVVQGNGHKLIAMVRDPRDALISHVFYMRNYKKNPNGDNRQRDFFVVGENFDSLPLNQQISSLIKGTNGCMSYVQFYKERVGWALQQGHLMVKYEELLGESGGGSNEVQRAKVIAIADYINLDLTDDELESVLEQMYVDFGEQKIENGKIFDRSTTGNWRKFLSKKQIALIKTMVGKEIIALGYEKNNRW